MKPKRLPGGMFLPGDIEVYRKLYESLPDNAVTVELGVYKGRSLCSVSDIVIKKNIAVMVVDTFEGTENYTRHFDDGFEAVFRKNLSKYGIEGNVTVHKATTDRVSVIYGDRARFDLVFIDADHAYKPVCADIVNWGPKVKIGSILAGHDYSRPYKESVKVAVNELIESPVLTKYSSIWYATKEPNGWLGNPV